MLSQTIRVAADGTVTRGIDVPHEAANIPCGASIGFRIDVETGAEWEVLCRKRVGHHQPKAEAKHVPVDMRLIGAPRRVVHAERYKPNTIPRGVDQNAVTVPHDCANHLPDTEQVLRRGW